MIRNDFPLIFMSHIESCLLSELQEELEIIDCHPEFPIREIRLPHKIKAIVKLLGDDDIRKYPSASEMLAHLIILFEELKTIGPWNLNYYSEYVEKLNAAFIVFYKIPIDGILRQNAFDTQEVFDQCIKIIYDLIGRENHKKFPSLVAVYCTLLMNVKEYKVVVNPSWTFHLALQLVNNFDSLNKQKGLKCCYAVLKSLKAKHFQDGNFYLFLFDTLAKHIFDKDVEIISLVIDCMLQVTRIMPPVVKASRLDTLFAMTLDQILTESNVYRKTVLFRYTKIIIKIHGSKCIDRRSLKGLICDNLDTCTDAGVADIMLFVVLECLEVWIQYCWFKKQFSRNKNILMTLFKVLYTCQDQSLVAKIQNIIVILINISTKEEQKMIRKSLERSVSFPNEEYQKRLSKIKEDIHV